MLYKYLFVIIIYFACYFCSLDSLFAQIGSQIRPRQASHGLILTQAVTCEVIQNHSPQNISVIFSADLEMVCCYTSFDPVPKKGNIYHTWYYRDNFVTKIKLAINPPRWSTFSSIQLRKMDKGPWRVEIEDELGKIYNILRFSVTD